MTELPDTPESSFAYQDLEHERVLVVDDNPTNLKLMGDILQDQPYKLLFAASGSRALSIAQKTKPSLILLDIMMPGMDGFEVCEELQADPETRDCVVIFLSALDDTASKVKGFSLGASDFITKPFQAEEVLARLRTHLTLRRLQETLRARNAELRHELQVARHLLEEADQRVEGPLVGESPAVVALRMAIQQYAETLEPILIQGPPGAGQESVARAIHRSSDRSHMAFIRVNCALLPTSLATRMLTLSQEPEGCVEEPIQESAEEAGPSPLWLAHRGTLFLEQFDALPEHIQESWSQLLDEFEEKRQKQLTPSPDIRLIASIRNGNSALPRKLCRHPIVLPSLAERQADIPLIARFFKRQTAQYLGKVVRGFTPDSLEHMQSYHWPGNIRELQNVIEREVTLTDDELISISMATLQGSEGLFVGGYQLQHKLGEGGMGEVWQARHQLLATPAAIKFIRFQQHMNDAAKQSWIQRFTKEAQVTAQLQSPHTVRLFDYGVDPTGAFSFYYVMELLQGVDLEAMIQQHGAQPAARVIAIMQPVCRSLAEAHQQGLIHRDIKPSNIFICALGGEYDYPKVLDFGVVKDTSSDALLTETNGDFICGTPGYIAPEQLNDEDSIDEKADVYSLGCVAFWALTGRLVFETNNPIQQILRHSTEPPPKPSRFAKAPIPEALDELILRCLAKQSSDRPSVTELGAALEALAAELPWTRESARRWWQQHQPGPSHPTQATASIPSAQAADENKDDALPPLRPGQEIPTFAKKTLGIKKPGQPT